MSRLLLLSCLICLACGESRNNEKSLEIHPPEGMVYVPAGEFIMGGRGAHALPREFPHHPVRVTHFFADKTEVTNEEFAEFIRQTGYVTVAERELQWKELQKQLPPGTEKPHDSLFQPGSLVFQPDFSVNSFDHHFQWWSWKIGANWKRPQGPGSTIKDIMNHPVVHIAIEDARAYATWEGKRLPTEAEWEWSARGGLEDQQYPWGDSDVNLAPYQCNFWQGTFPSENTAADGYIGTAPVGSFNSNGFGLYDMAGNVWEITSDWYDTRYYQTLSQTTHTENPKGPLQSFNPQAPYGQYTVIKGGSFLCNDSYCASYRISARMPLEIDAAMNHVGFRCVKDVE